MKKIAMISFCACVLIGLVIATPITANAQDTLDVEYVSSAL